MAHCFNIIYVTIELRRKMKLKRHKSLLTMEAVIFKACPCTILISTNSTWAINIQKLNYEVNNIKKVGVLINLYNSYGSQKSFTQGFVVTRVFTGFHEHWYANQTWSWIFILQSRQADSQTCPSICQQGVSFLDTFVLSCSFHSSLFPTHIKFKTYACMKTYCFVPWNLKADLRLYGQYYIKKIIIPSIGLKLCT